MGPIEFLMALWPCPGKSCQVREGEDPKFDVIGYSSEQRRRYHELIDSLTKACMDAKIPPPQIYSPVAITRPIPR